MLKNSRISLVPLHVQQNHKGKEKQTELLDLILAPEPLCLRVSGQRRVAVQKNN